MSAQASEPGEQLPYPVFHLEGDAAIVPLHELRVLRALREQASPDAIRAAERAAELAEGAEVLARHDEWIAAGRPGAVPHEEFRKVLLGGAGG
jgi:hypothetical protein